MIRFRPAPLLAAVAIAAISAAFAHPARAAGKPAPPAASPAAAPAPSPTATPETLDHAIPRLEAALKANPNDKDSMIELAGDYLSANRPDLAVELTQKLLQSGTKTAQVYYLDGVAQNAIGKTDAGIASMEQSANLEPTNIQVLQTLTQMYLSANRPADAERVAKRALTFNASSKEAGLTYAYVLAVEKKFDEARAQFEAVQKLDPKDPHPIVLEAQTYVDGNSLALAKPLLDKALALDPKNLETLSAEADLAAAMNDVKTSIGYYNQILALVPDQAQKAAVVDQEGAVYAHAKQDSDADAAFRNAIDNYGGLPQAHMAYGDYLAAKNDKAGAQREWTTAAGPNKDNGDALARLGGLAAAGNDFTTAIADYKRLTEVAANDPRAYLLLGQAYMGAKNWNSARDAFKASFNLARSPEALVGLAAADQQTRNWTEAIQIYESIDKNAQPLVKQNPEVLYELGNAYKGANQLQKAKATYQRFLAYLKPGTQGYTQVKQMIADLDKPAGKPAAKAPAKTTAKPGAKPTAKPAH